MSENKYTDEFFKEYEERFMKPSTAPNEKPVQNTQTTQKPNTKNKYHIMFVVSIVAIVVVVIVLGFILIKGMTKPKDDGKKENTNKVVSQVEKPSFKPAPAFNKDTVDFGSSVVSEHAILVNLDENIVVASKNSDARIYPASLTKVLTLLVAVENVENFDDTFEMTYEITDPAFEAGASMAGFQAGEVITIKDLLYGAILPSGAEATSAIAIYVAGNEAEFAELMNAKVKELGITTAHFTNASGLHDDNHYCTVMDMAIILRAAMENEMCREILSTYQYTTSVTPQNPEGLLLTSTLFSRMYGDEPEGAIIQGGKTGFTSEAGNCIASFGVSDSGKEYILVTTKAQGLWKAVYDHINVYTEYVK